MKKVPESFGSWKYLKLYLHPQAGVAQLVERQPSKLNVAGSNPVSRSTKKPYRFDRAFLF
tara:strand:- start:393 stop:572 length:180 start_codon:yes stop_codon:yes gene_type:complete